LEKLEESEVFASPQQLIRRLHVALNGAALRLTGKLYQAAPHDPANWRRILDEVSIRFIAGLSDVELDHLETGLRGLGTGKNAIASKAVPEEPRGSSMNPEPVAEWQ
jgi:hypothetical protein